MFDAIDENKDGKLSDTELKALVIGIRFEEMDLDSDDATSKLLQDFDISNDSYIDVDEFANAIKRWILEAKRVGMISADSGPQTMKALDNFHVVSV